MPTAVAGRCVGPVCANLAASLNERGDLRDPTGGVLRGRPHHDNSLGKLQPIQPCCRRRTSFSAARPGAVATPSRGSCKKLYLPTSPLPTLSSLSEDVSEVPICHCPSCYLVRTHPNLFTYLFSIVRIKLDTLHHLPPSLLKYSYKYS